MSHPRSPHAPALGLALVLVLGTGCARDPFRVETETGLAVALAVDPAPPLAGRVRVAASIADERGAAVEGARVQFFYWMPYSGVPAAPEHEIKVAGGTGRNGGFVATVPLQKPGLWKIAVKVERPGREPDLATFTVTVQEQTTG